MRALLKFELKVPVEVHKGATAFIARCPIFEVSSQGKSPAEAKKTSSTRYRSSLRPASKWEPLTR